MERIPSPLTVTAGKNQFTPCVKTGVAVVFHGHDHFFGRQEKNGIIYQLVAQPANRNFNRHQAKEYGYEKGDCLPNSGSMRVTVTPDQIKIKYLRKAGSAGMEYSLTKRRE